MLQVVLVHPLIPQNTGNIARTCAATRTPLHLVEPLGFELSDRYLKRAGLDYWPYVNVRIHPSLDELKQACPTIPGSARWVCFSVRGQQAYTEYKFQSGDCLLFGSETEGLPDGVLTSHDTVYIPMAEPGVRSLNLSVSVAVGLFEARRQLGL
ncbi:tRNA (cytidine(34)-2'-O)-methyltransferase [Leptolyngbya sp. FACHB-261]|uniref:tRNA (cytidine(34)-2'-O)-methyltransferase n=1 Tax=Leptolyngbya sp. FACHB-261 TaxID=2692806 RepID=UPI0016875743|nr:tRNA (cytidine(34)-2'-O)-methyltransferase [Leptolyngbya sp. FACHB-261]MBD2104585.1 tRNA (cytidine(34)-2'-O)-methyltransferase [Leptolyngbya sp. FACHB-261]